MRKEIKNLLAEQKKALTESLATATKKQEPGIRRKLHVVSSMQHHFVNIDVQEIPSKYQDADYKAEESETDQ